jgi:CheY-like chemotaxis protein
LYVEGSRIGIDHNSQKRLFKRFEQGLGIRKYHLKQLSKKNTETVITADNKYGGSGLGLFICRRLCAIQAGEIGFSSEEGKGSRFAFFIKVRRSEAPELQTSHGILDMSSPYHVLIIEDNTVLRRTMEMLLRRNNCQVHAVDDGRQGVEFVKKSQFAAEADKDWPRLDVVLMDMQMPVMDGCTATRMIRELEATGELVRHVPIIGISANVLPAQVRCMREAGMDDSISKPFSVPDILARFQGLLGRLTTE